MASCDDLNPLNGLQQVATAYTGKSHRCFVFCSEVRANDEWHLALALPGLQKPSKWWHVQHRGLKRVEELLVVSASKSRSCSETKAESSKLAET